MIHINGSLNGLTINMQDNDGPRAPGLDARTGSAPIRMPRQPDIPDLGEDSDSSESENEYNMKHFKGMLCLVLLEAIFAGTTSYFVFG